MPDLQKEIKEKLDGLVGTIEQIQGKANDIEQKYDALDVEALMKMKTDSADAVEALSKLQASQKAQEELIKELELQVAKGGGEGQDGLLDEKVYKQALVSYMRKGGEIDDGVLDAVCRNVAAKSLIGVDEAKHEMMIKDLIAGSNPDGGFFLTTERTSKISQRVFETSPLRPLCSIMTTGSDQVEMLLDDDEASAGWVGETDDRPDTDTSEIGKIVIPAHEIYAQPKATQKMLDDAGFDLEGWLSGKVQRKFARKENTAFVVGDGSQKPKGFLTYDAWSSAGVYQRKAVEQIETAAASVMAGDDLIKLQNSLIEDYQINATWGMKRATWYDVATLKDSQGRYLLNPRIIAEGADKILLGSGVTFMNDMPAVADGALPVVLADWQEFYTIVDRFGIRVLRDPYTAKPYMRFYTTKRVGGAVTNYEAGKILKIQAA